MKRDDLTEIEAQQRVDAQMSIERKKELAHIVIDNSLGIRETRSRVNGLIKHLKPSWFSTVVAWVCLGWPAAILYSTLTVIKWLKL
jgi:dephospho-CoA kinase